MAYYFILLLPCFVCLFWAILFVCRWKKNYRAQNTLAFCMFFLSIFFFILGNFFAGTDDFVLYYKLDIIDSFVTLMIYPMCHLFFKSLTDENRFGWKDFIWFFPALVIGSSTGILYGMMGEANAIKYVQAIIAQTELPVEYTTGIYKLHYFLSINAYNFILLIEGIGTGIYATTRLIQYRRKLNEFYSSLEDKSLDNNYAILLGYLISILLSFVILFLGRFYINQHQGLIIPLFISLAIVCFFLCYQASILKYTIESFTCDLEKADREASEQAYESLDEIKIPNNENETEKSKRHQQLVETFKLTLEHEKFYLQNNLRLDDVARMMRTNRTYISRMINEEFQTTFSNYINLKRIEYAQTLMCSNTNISQEQIAEKSGFSHTSSFCRTFKQFTGMTPKEWQRKNAHQ